MPLNKETKLFYNFTFWAFMKRQEKKARWELQKDAACCLEHVLEVAHNKTTAVRSLTSHLTNHPRKMNKICWALLEKLGQIHNLHSSWISSRGHTSVYRRAKTCIHQI